MHWAQRLLDDRFTLADRLLADRGGFFDHYTAPDAYFFWAFLRATRSGLKHLDLSKFKNYQAHLSCMQQRPSVRRLLEFERQT